MSDFKKFSSINQFRHVVAYVNYNFDPLKTGKSIPTLTFRGTVKLHGANCGIRRRMDGKFIPQSRENELIGRDNYGFAEFIHSIDEDKLHDLFDKISDTTQDVIIFGEWIGKGIQSKVAITQLEKQFVIFGAWSNNDEKYIANVPELSIRDENVFNILDIPTYSIDIDFSSPELALSTLQELTVEVENECPWAKRSGISGIGEGIVWHSVDYPEISKLWFKTKGDKHGNKCKTITKVATVSPEKLNTIKELVDCVLPDWRLHQGLAHLRENNLEVGMENISHFLKWVGQDVKKEEMDTIEASGLNWKDVNKHIINKAKTFFAKQTESLL